MTAAASYTLAERARLRLALPDLVERERQLRDRAAAAGIFYVVPEYGGTRTEADQAQLVKWRDEAVAKGGSAAYYQVAPFGKSKHEVGAAFDTTVTARPAGMSLATAQAQLGQMGEAVGLTWGGRWAAPTTDIGHFELKATRAALAPIYASFLADDPVAAAGGKLAAVIGGEGLATAAKGGGVAAGVAACLVAYVLLFPARRAV